MNLIQRLPKFRFIREMQREPRYASLEHIEAMLTAAQDQDLPVLQNVRAEQYWRCMVLFPFLTGWRIDQFQSIHRDHLDFDRGRCVSLAEDNKGKRDVDIPLPPELLSELRPVWASFEEFPLRWPVGSRSLYVEFGRLQVNAGIHLPCTGDHEHSPACHVYGFHDLRRSFATYNAARLSTWQLKSLMQHKSLRTTERYVAMGQQLEEAPRVLIPESIRRGG